jgi:tetratricopeptide (TPR) repeat protein
MSQLIHFIRGLSFPRTHNQPTTSFTRSKFRRLLAILFSAGITLLTPAPAQTTPPHKPGHRISVPDERAGTIIATAEAALDKKDYATAEPLLKQAVQDDPDDYRAWFDLGFLYSVTNRKAEAIAAYRKSVAADPKVFESTFNLGILLAQAHDSEAEKYLREATQLKPTAKPDEAHGRAWLSLGHLLEPSDAAGALAAYAESAKLQPSDPEPHLSAGALLEHQDKLVEAGQEYTKAAQLDPKSADAELGLANIYQKSRQLPEAEMALRKYIELEPQNSAAYFQLGRVLAAENKSPEAIDAYEGGLKLQPSDQTGIDELSSVYALAGKPEKAEPLLRAYLAAHPNDARTHAQMGSVLLHEHKNIEAQTELIEALKLDPNQPDVCGDLALAASDSKNYELTIRALDVRAKLGTPESPGTYFLRATAYDHLKAPKQAAEFYRKFLETANGRFPDQEWEAKHRLIAIEPKK